MSAITKLGLVVSRLYTCGTSVLGGAHMLSGRPEQTFQGCLGLLRRLSGKVHSAVDVPKLLDKKAEKM